MPGSGLGLAIVRQIAERHGGSVRAGTSRAGGAAFWFTVPGSPKPDRVDGVAWTSEQLDSAPGRRH
jgi:two-component system sensor histidine kinase MprB